MVAIHVESSARKTVANARVGVCHRALREDAFCVGCETNAFGIATASFG